VQIKRVLSLARAERELAMRHFKAILMHLLMGFNEKQPDFARERPSVDLVAAEMVSDPQPSIHWRGCTPYSVLKYSDGPNKFWRMYVCPIVPELLGRLP